MIADVAARLAQRDQEDVHSKRKLRGRREGSVLDPCRLALDFTLAAGSGPTAALPIRVLLRIPSQVCYDACV